MFKTIIVRRGFIGLLVILAIVFGYQNCARVGYRIPVVKIIELNQNSEICVDLPSTVNFDECSHQCLHGTVVADSVDGGQAESEVDCVTQTLTPDPDVETVVEPDPPAVVEDPTMKIFSATLTEDIHIPQIDFKFIIDNSESMAVNSTSVRETVGVMFDNKDDQHHLNDFNLTAEVYNTAALSESPTNSNINLWGNLAILSSGSFDSYINIAALNLPENYTLEDMVNTSMKNTEHIDSYFGVQDRPSLKYPGDVIGLSFWNQQNLSQMNGFSVSKDLMRIDEVFSAPAPAVTMGGSQNQFSYNTQSYNPTTMEQNYNYFVDALTANLAILDPDLTNNILTIKSVEQTKNNECFYTTPNRYNAYSLCKEQIKTDIVSKESGLCQMARILNQRQRLLQSLSPENLQNEIAKSRRNVFVLVTDENDFYNDGKACVESEVTKYYGKYNCEYPKANLIYTGKSKDEFWTGYVVPKEFIIEYDQVATETLFKVDMNWKIFENQTVKTCSGAETKIEGRNVCCIGVINTVEGKTTCSQETSFQSETKSVFIGQGVVPRIRLLVSGGYTGTCDWPSVKPILEKYYTWPQLKDLISDEDVNNVSCETKAQKNRGLSERVKTIQGISEIPKIGAWNYNELEARNWLYNGLSQSDFEFLYNGTNDTNKTLNCSTKVLSKLKNACLSAVELSSESKLTRERENKRCGEAINLPTGMPDDFANPIYQQPPTRFGYIDTLYKTASDSSTYDYTNCVIRQQNDIVVEHRFYTPIHYRFFIKESTQLPFIDQIAWSFRGFDQNDTITRAKAQIETEFGALPWYRDWITNTMRTEIYRPGDIVTYKKEFFLPQGKSFSDYNENSKCEDFMLSDTHEIHDYYNPDYSMSGKRISFADSFFRFVCKNNPGKSIKELIVERKFYNYQAGIQSDINLIYAFKEVTDRDNPYNQTYVKNTGKGSPVICQYPAVLLNNGIDLNGVNTPKDRIKKFVAGTSYLMPDGTWQSFDFDPNKDWNNLQVQPTSDLTSHILQQIENLYVNYGDKIPVIKIFAKTGELTASETTLGQSKGDSYIQLVNKYNEKYGQGYSTIANVTSSNEVAILKSLYSAEFANLTTDIRDKVQLYYPIQVELNLGKMSLVDFNAVDSIVEVCIYRTINNVTRCDVVSNVYFELVNGTVAFKDNPELQNKAVVHFKQQIALQLKKGTKFSVKVKLKE